MALYPSLLLFPGPTIFPGTSLTYRFTPPFTIRDHRIEGGLFGSLQYGITVMRIDGVWVEAEFPSWEQESNADVLFRGGSVSQVVEPDIAASLAAAGYEVEEGEE